MSLNKKHLKSYLKILFIMNNRVEMGFSKKSKTSRRWAKQFFSLVVMGLLSLLIVSKLPDFQLGMTIFFSMLLMMMLTSFLGEYSNILLDSKDNSVLFHQPISSKTIFTGRLIYILISALACGLALSAPTLIYVFVAKGAVVGSTFLLACLLTTFLSVFCALFLYLIILKALGGEKFKDIMNYIQIGFSLIFFACYYYSVELLDIKDLANYTFTYQWWSVFVPPMWQVSLIDTINGAVQGGLNLILCVLAILTPAILGFFSYRYLSSDLKTGLVKLDNKELKKEVKRRFSLSSMYAKLFTINNQERSLFSLYRSLLSRDRNFKMMVYPTLGYCLVLPVIQVFKAYKESGLSEETSPSVYITALYYLSMLFITSLSCVSIGDNNKLNDIYKVAPLKKPGMILSSTLKVLSYNFLIIPLFLSSFFVYYIWGWSHLLSVVTVFFSISLLGIFRMLAGEFKLPLSISKADSSKTIMGVMIFLVMIMLAILGVIHYFIMQVPYGLIVYTSILAIIYFMSMRALREKAYK